MDSSSGSSGPSASSARRGCLFLLPALVAAGVAAWLLRDGIPPAENGFAPPELVVAAVLFLLSLIVGVVMFVRGLVRARRGAVAPDGGSAPEAPVKPLTGSAKSGGKKSFPVGCFFSVFLIVGLGFMIPFVLMLWGLVASHLWWEETTCTVTSSSVGSHAGDDSTTYSIDIEYLYDWDGIRHTGDRYNFSFGSSSGYDGKAAVVERHPVGAEVPCFVNPRDPDESVLVRSVGWEVLFILLPLVFVAVGGGGLLASAGFFGKFSWTKKKEDWLPGTTDEEPAVEGPRDRTPSVAAIRQEFLPHDRASEDPYVLKTTSSPKGRLIGTTVAAVLWNGITWSIIYFAGIKGGGMDGCAYAFLGVFALIGLLLLVSVPHAALALANPRPVLRLGGDLAPGRTVRVSWRFEGRASRIRHLRFRIEGREEATYRRGTDTHTAKNTFYEQTIFESTDPGTIPSGETTFSLPADTMHSFDGGNNEIAWRLSVEGDIPRWPDVREEFELVVRPEGLAR